MIEEITFTLSQETLPPEALDTLRKEALRRRVPFNKLIEEGLLKISRQINAKTRGTAVEERELAGAH